MTQRTRNCFHRNRNFLLTAQDSGHFADILTAASSNANTNVSILGESFKYCAPIAGALGFSCEDTAKAFGLMANAGIKSTQSGTSMRSIITVLSGEVKFCSESFWEMEIATTNSDGSMRSLSTILTICRMQKLHSSKQKIRTLHFCPQMAVLYLLWFRHW